MIRGILFDMDGVLFDTERLGRDVLSRISARRGYPMTEDAFQRMLGTTSAHCRLVLHETFGAGYPYEEIMAEYVAELVGVSRRGELPLKPGVAECMAGLKARGLPLALATSTERAVVEVYLQNAPALTCAFDAVVCGGEAARSKPAPDIYLAVAARLGLDPRECLGVEDSMNGLRSLRAAGCRCVMIPDMLPFDERFHGVVDDVLPDLGRLCPLIDRLGLGARTRA